MKGMCVVGGGECRQVMAELVESEGGKVERKRGS